MAKNTFDLTLDAITEGQLEYALVSHKGELIYEEFQYLYPGLNEIQLSLQDLPEGAYKVVLKLDNEEELCAQTIGSEFDADIFYKHLKGGLDVFNKRQLLKK